MFLPEKSHGQRSLVGYSPWGLKESDLLSKQQQQWSIAKCRGRPGGIFHSLLSVVNSTWLQPLKHMGPPSGRGRWLVGSPRLNSTEHVRSHIVDGSKRWLSIACSFWVFSLFQTYRIQIWSYGSSTSMENGGKYIDFLKKNQRHKILNTWNSNLRRLYLIERQLTYLTCNFALGTNISNVLAKEYCREK